MPSSLTSTKIKDTYGQVLHVDGGVTTTPKTVYDGDGTATALKVSTTGAVVETSSSTDALRITQVGAGNALVVEDSANPDATPFVVDANGKVLIANKTPIAALSGRTAQLQYNSVEATAPATILASFYSGTNYGSEIQFIASKSGTAGTFGGAVANGQGLGSLQFYGDDGTAGIPAAQIYAAVDGTPGTNDMPGRLVFSTTADGASSPTERMRITNAGQFGINGAPSSGNYQFQLGGTIISAGTASYGFVVDTTVPSASTASANMFYTSLKTQAAAFTLGTATHFSASQGTIGSGSAITSQYGFIANSTLTGATNNYGFYSNIASGTGRYNFYAAGSADNYFAGAIGVGTTSLASTNISSNRNLTGATSASSIVTSGPIQSDVTSEARSFVSYLQTSGAVWTLGQAKHYFAQQGTFGSTSVSNQYGFTADGSLTGATNNYGFYSAIASGTGRYNFYAAGTADNFFAGNVGIGGTDSTVKLFVGGSTSTVANISGSNSLAASLAIRATNAAAYPGLSLSSWVAWTTAKDVGQFRFDGLSSTGTYAEFAAIYATAGTNTATGAPTYLTFRTSDGTNNAATERMRIDSAGRVGIGATPATSQKFTVVGSTLTDSTFYTVDAQTNVPATGTVGAYQFRSVFGTVASSFTLPTMVHFSTAQITIGSGSTVTSQYGFRVESSLTGATNNYGFYSNIASGTGRYNFYAAGSAANYMAGPLTAQNFTSIGVNSDLVSSAANLYTLSGIGGTLSSLLWRFVTGANDSVAGTERMRITASGAVLIGTSTAGASKLVVNDDSIQINTAKTPASATATGTAGQVAWDANYMYVCVATNTWKRSAIATW